VVEPTEEEQVTSCAIAGTRPVLSSIVEAPAEAAIEINDGLQAKPTAKDSPQAKPDLKGKEKELYLNNIMLKINRK